jgi:hypothetical protein
MTKLKAFENRRYIGAGAVKGGFYVDTCDQESVGRKQRNSRYDSNSGIVAGEYRDVRTMTATGILDASGLVRAGTWLVDDTYGTLI